MGAEVLVPKVPSESLQNLPRMIARQTPTVPATVRREHLLGHDAPPARATRRRPCRHAKRCADGQARARVGCGPRMCPLQVQNPAGLAAALNGVAARAVKD